MADQTKTSTQVHSVVHTALKATIESELSRATLPSVAGAAFSRGVIFSKSDPFSRGVIFSKAAGGDRMQEEKWLTQTQQMDDAAFHSFADRLVKLKELKSKGSGGG